jgi:hypothetical protein
MIELILSTFTDIPLLVKIPVFHRKIYLLFTLTRLQAGCPQTPSNLPPQLPAVAASIRTFFTLSGALLKQFSKFKNIRAGLRRKGV